MCITCIESGLRSRPGVRSLGDVCQTSQYRSLTTDSQKPIMRENALRQIDHPEAVVQDFALAVHLEARCDVALGAGQFALAPVDAPDHGTGHAALFRAVRPVVAADRREGQATGRA